jgi:hypothetical protein
MPANEQVPASFDPAIAKALLAATTPEAVEAGLYGFVAWADTPQGNTSFWDDQAACRVLFPKGRTIIEECLRLSER